MKQRAETKAALEKKIDECNRRLEELKALTRPAWMRRSTAQSRSLRHEVRARAPILRSATLVPAD
jgi:hypothetical protein